MATIVEARSHRLVVSITRDALSALLFSRTQDILRALILERTKMATATRSLISRLSLVQSEAGRVARALSSATLLALPVWSGVGVCECATGFVAADDRLFSPALTRIAAAEYCREPWSGGAGDSSTPGFADRAS